MAKTKAKSKGKSITIACTGAGVLSIDLMNPLQEDFKTLEQDKYEALKTEILEEGFSSPIYIWEDPKDSLTKILDGHQRVETLKRMRDEGYDIPQVPVVYVEATDVQQAVRKLAAFASQYGTAHEEGFANLLTKYKIDFTDLSRKISFPSLDSEKILQKLNITPVNLEITKFEAPDAKTKTVSGLPSAQIKQVQLFFTTDNHQKFIHMTNSLMGSLHIENLSDLLMELVDEAYRTTKENP